MAALFKENNLPEDVEFEVIRKDTALKALGMNKSYREDALESISLKRRRKRLENFADDESTFMALSFLSRDSSKYCILILIVTEVSHRILFEKNLQLNDKRLYMVHHR